MQWLKYYGDVDRFEAQFMLIRFNSQNPSLHKI